MLVDEQEANGMLRLESVALRDAAAAAERDAKAATNLLRSARARCAELQACISPVSLSLSLSLSLFLSLYSVALVLPISQGRT